MRKLQPRTEKSHPFFPSNRPLKAEVLSSHPLLKIWLEAHPLPPAERGSVFGYPYCSSSNSTEFSAEHEDKCSFPFHKGNSIPTIRDMLLDVIARKKKIYNFLHEIHHIYVYKKNNDRRRDFMDQIFAGEFSGKDSVGVLRQNVWMGSILYGLMLSQEYRKFPLQGITFFDLHKWSSEKPNNKPKAYCWRHASFLLFTT